MSYLMSKLGQKKINKQGYGLDRNGTWKRDNSLNPLAFFPV